MSKFFYLLREGVKNIWKNSFMTIASVGILVTCLIIMGSFALATININDNIMKLADDNEIVIFIEDTVPTEQARAMQSEIEAIDNINTVEFIDKNTAWEEFLATRDDAQLYRDSIDESPLRDQFVITMKDISLMHETVQNLEQLDNIGYIRYREDVAQNLVRLKNMMMVIAATFMAILVSLSVFIISNTIKLGMFARRKEINIMKYVGATNGFIRLPFMVEGIIIGAISGGIAYGLQWYIYTYLVEKVVGEYQFFNMVPFENYSMLLLIVFMAVALIVGLIGSVVSIRKYLNV